MPLPVIPDVYRVALLWGVGVAEHAVNVLHVHKVASTPASVAADFETNVTANMWAPVSSTALVQFLGITKLDGASAEAVIATTGGAKWTGGSIGDRVPQASVLIKLFTGVRGPKGRGRLFLPAIAENAIANGATAFSLVAMQAAWTAFINAMSAASVPVQVASYRHALSNAVASATVETVLATQRRRQSRLR